MLRFLRRLLGLGLVAGTGYAIWKYLEKQRDDSGVAWEPQPFPYPPQPRQEAARAESSAAGGQADSGQADGGQAGDGQAGDGQGWVEPDGDSCPTGHPVKAKMSSKIFHVPGGANYERTKPDRCYSDERAAEADGLRKAAR